MIDQQKYFLQRSNLTSASDDGVITSSSSYACKEGYMVFNETEYVYNVTSGDLWLIVYNITVPSQEVIAYNTTYAVCVDNYDFNASKE